MKPYLHAMVSVRQWGGQPEDYLPIHDFIDSSKATFPDMRHRAILHSSFGCYVVERCFGHMITLSSGKLVSSRDIAEQHILDDMGRIPEVGDYLRGMPMYDWLGGRRHNKRVIRNPGELSGRLVLDTAAPTSGGQEHGSEIVD